jgi:hypothetical protein
MPNAAVALIETDHKTTMKIYQIAAKQYSVIGEDLYERLEVATIGRRDSAVSSTSVSATSSIPFT